MRGGEQVDEWRDGLTKQQSRARTKEDVAGTDEIGQQSFAWRQAGFEQDGVVAEFLWQFVGENGQCGHQTKLRRGGEGEGDQGAVGEVV